MNEKSSIRELLNQLRNSEYWVKKIVAEYLGVDPKRIEIKIKEETK